MSVLQNLATFFRYLNMSPDAIGQELEQNERNRYKQEGRDLLASFMNKNKSDNDRANSSINAISKTPNLDKMNQMSYVNSMPIPENQNGGLYKKKDFDIEREYANKTAISEPQRPQETDISSLLPYSDDPAIANSINTFRDRDKSKFEEYENQRKNYDTTLSNADKEYKFKQAIEDFRNSLTPDQAENPAFKSLLTLANMGDSEGVSKILSNQIPDIGKEVYANKDKFKYDSDIENLKSKNTIREKGAQFGYDKQLKEMENKLKTSSELAGIDPETGKPYTSTQRTAASYALRVGEAENTLDQLASKGFNPASIKSYITNPKKLEAVKDPAMRQYAQAMRTFINATLRRESGAAIAESEFDNANIQYFASLRDDDETLEQKKRSRLQVYAGLKAEAGTAYDRASEEYEKLKTNFKTISPVFLQGKDGKRLEELRAKMRGGR